MYRIIFLLLLRRPTSSTLPDTLFPYTTLSRSNGVTPRRWLYNCNPPLRGLLREAIGDGWVTDLEQLQRLAPLADDAGFRERFAAAKDANRSEEHTSELQSLMRNSYAVFCLKKTTNRTQHTYLQTSTHKLH